MTNLNQALACVDLGSNSFRLFLARAQESPHGIQIRPKEDFKESVRLAAGLDDRNILSQVAIDTALKAISRFGERIRGFSPANVRAVATSTLRIAKNSSDVIAQLQSQLGFNIQVISGYEEARLVYIGAAHSLPVDGRKRLVIDIGGGSTECIIGCDYEPNMMDSVGIGCVSTTQDWFKSGRLTNDSFEKCYLFARSRLASASAEYRSEGWQDAFGTSGSAKMLTQICETLFGEAILTPKRLREIQQICVDAKTMDQIHFDGLRADRRAVLPGGLATMRAVLDEFEVNTMRYATGALRDGVLYDLVGRQRRDQQGDMREVAVANLATRTRVNTEHANHIEKTAIGLLAQLVDPSSAEYENDSHLLSWAARLHEVGQSIAHDHYHKHSAYIAEHSDLRGFSQNEQREIAWLLLGHAGKLGKLAATQTRETLWLLVIALRLSVILHRRRDGMVPNVIIKWLKNKIKISIDPTWLVEHPMTDFLLSAELAEWNKAKIFSGFELNSD